MPFWYSSLLHIFIIFDDVTFRCHIFHTSYYSLFTLRLLSSYSGLFSSQSSLLFFRHFSHLLLISFPFFISQVFLPQETFIFLHAHMSFQLVLYFLRPYMFSYFHVFSCCLHIIFSSCFLPFTPHIFIESSFFFRLQTFFVFIFVCHIFPYLADIALLTEMLSPFQSLLLSLFFIFTLRLHFHILLHAAHFPYSELSFFH